MLNEGFVQIGQSPAREKTSYRIHQSEDRNRAGRTLSHNLQGRFLWVRARVPIYRLFLTIFLWFWVTAWGMLAIVFLVNDLKGMREITAPSMYATIAPILAAEAAKTYESGGPKAFARFSQNNVVDHQRQLFLLDGFYKDVLSGTLTADGLRVAHAVKASTIARAASGGIRERLH